MNNYNNEPLFLKKEDIDKLRLIGYGKDANVYDAKNGFLYKIYHKNLLPNQNILTKAIYDDNGVRIDRPKIINNSESRLLSYFDADGTRLFSSSAINSAIKKQYK